MGETVALKFKFLDVPITIGADFFVVMLVLGALWRTPEQHAAWLLAQLLSWHRREAKSFWWRYFHLLNDLTDDERVGEREPIGRLELVGPVGETARV